MTFSNEFEAVLKPAIGISADEESPHTLRELYEAKKKRLGLSDRKVQSLLGMQAGTINPILDGTTSRINLVSFIKLANFIGVGFDKLAVACLPVMEADAIGEIQKARDAGFLVEVLDLRVLTSSGFLKTDATMPEIKGRITRFFGIGSIYDYTGIGSLPAFSRTRRSSSEKMRAFWVRSAWVQFDTIANPNPYDRARLLALVPKIRPCSRNEAGGLLAVMRSLYAVGVTVIYQPHIGCEQVRGATMCVKGKPCIVLSNLNNKYPTLWFTLMHELYHVLFDFADIMDETYHISSGEGDLLLTDEDKADHFSEEYMLSADKLQFITAYIDAPTVVGQYARKWGVHPSVIYAAYCHRHGGWAKFSHRIPNMEKALEMVNTAPFERDSLEESARKIKELLTIS